MKSQERQAALAQDYLATYTAIYSFIEVEGFLRSSFKLGYGDWNIKLEAFICSCVSVCVCVCMFKAWRLV